MTVSSNSDSSYFGIDKEGSNITRNINLYILIFGVQL